MASLQILLARLVSLYNLFNILYNLKVLKFKTNDKDTWSYINLKFNNIFRTLLKCYDGMWKWEIYLFHFLFSAGIIIYFRKNQI